MSTDDIVGFITARLDEDEQVAQALRGESWSAAAPAHGMRRVTVDFSIEYVVSVTVAERGVHIARHDPARVLRGVEAKRKALALHAQGHECPSEAEEPNVASWYESDCPTLRAVACEWSTHPDFRPEADGQVIKRLTHHGDLIEAPLGTTKCAQTIGSPSPSDWIHTLFASQNLGPMVQLMTKCGRRAHRFILEAEGREVDCPECLEDLEAEKAES